MTDIPTMRDIEMMALSNPVLYACLQVKVREGLDDDQFYRLCIGALVGEVEQLRREQLEWWQSECAPVLRFDFDYEERSKSDERD